MFSVSTALEHCDAGLCIEHFTGEVLGRSAAARPEGLVDPRRHVDDRRALPQAGGGTASAEERVFYLRRIGHHRDEDVRLCRHGLGVGRFHGA